MSTVQRKMSKTTKNNTNEKYKKRPKQKKKETNSTTGRQKQKSKVKKKGQTREETPYASVYGQFCQLITLSIFLSTFSPFWGQNFLVGLTYQFLIRLD